MSVRVVYLVVCFITLVSSSPLPKEYEDNVAEESVNTQFVPKIEEAPYRNNGASFVEGIDGSDHSLHITPVYSEPGILTEDSETTTVLSENETTTTTEDTQETTSSYGISNSDPKYDISKSSESEKTTSDVEIVENDGPEAKHSENLELSEENVDNQYESENIEDETSDGEYNDESSQNDSIIESNGESDESHSVSVGEYGSYEESGEKLYQSYEYNPSDASDENHVSA